MSSVVPIIFAPGVSRLEISQELFIQIIFTRQEMGCRVHEGQPQREHQRCPAKPDSVSSELVENLWRPCRRFRNILDFPYFFVVENLRLIMFMEQVHLQMHWNNCQDPGQGQCHHPGLLQKGFKISFMN